MGTDLVVSPGQVFCVPVMKKYPGLTRGKMTHRLRPREQISQWPQGKLLEEFGLWFFCGFSIRLQVHVSGAGPGKLNLSTSAPSYSDEDGFILSLFIPMCGWRNI